MIDLKMTRRKTVFMFSGQGSQYFQMGRSFFERDGVFARSMRRMDALATELTGRSIVAQIYGDRTKSEPMTETALSHPAIYMVEVALAETLMDAGVSPDAVLGSSLGMFAAATVAGCMQMEDGLSFVIQQAASLESRCEPGGMIAILEDSSFHAQHPELQRAVIASYSFPSHFVLSAHHDDLPAIEAFLRARGTVYQRLPVSFAYHSHWIEPAREPIMEMAGQLPLSRPAIPLWCCASAAAITDLTADHFWSVARTPIFFQHTIEQIERTGSHKYLDLGPAGTLATFLKYLLPGDSASSAHVIMSPYGRDSENFLAALVK